MSETMLAHYESKRDIALKRLSDVLTCARNCVKDTSLLPRLESRCSRLDILLESFSEAHVNVMTELAKLGDDDRRKAEVNHQEEADDVYYEILEIKQKLIPSPSTSEKPPEPQPTPSKPVSKLPTIKLPSFSGEYKDFPGFIDLFNSLVHNKQNLSNVEKFNYLVTSLSGDPVNFIRAYPITEANYLNAYTALVDRYTDKRYLAFLSWEQIIHSKSMHSSSVQHLRTLLSTYTENIAVLNSLGLKPDEWDFVLFHSLLTKLDKQSREAFEIFCKGDDFPPFIKLTTFLQDRCNALERSSFSLNNNQTSSSSFRNPNNNNILNNRVKTNIQTQQRPRPTSTMLLAHTSNCLLCKDNHAIYSCPTFISKSPQDRLQIVKNHKLCLNCLRPSHSVSKCLVTHNCKTCNKRHNTLLHFPTYKSLNNLNQQQPNQLVQNSNNQIQSAPELNVGVVSHAVLTTNSSSFVLLATAEIEVKDHWGFYQKVRILLDPGSQSHIITNSCVRRLGLSRHRNHTPMSGIGQIPTLSSSKVFIEFRPKGQSQHSFTAEAVTLDKICGDMPSYYIDTNSYKHISNLKLADEQFNISRPIDMLIGGEIFPQILLPGKIEGINETATAINTIFGWILMGRTTTSANVAPILSVNHLSIDTNLDLAIQKFWDVDSIPKQKTYSDDDIRCEEVFSSTHKRDSDGRYIVQLPFRDTEPMFSGSYNIALRRFLQLEKRLEQNQSFGDQYKSHIMEYISSGQMESIPPSEHKSATAYYIPHHAVVKPDSLTTKLRVVYDASAKDAHGISLNDTLLTGCKLQSDINNILLRFRLHPIVFSADIRQMYRQIIISKNHINYQRIIFRHSPSEPIQEFRINRVTFGVSSSPFLAIRTMHQLAHDEKDSYPQAAEVLLNDLYVDDVVTGCQTVEEAQDLQNQLTNIMSAGGFELRKWSSNHADLLSNVPDEHRAIPDLTFDSDTNFIKILGLAWNAKQDIFNYQVNYTPRNCTKRTMLSELARIYDPIGLLTPLTFLTKFLIQRLWLLGTSWDEPVPDDINQIWIKITEQLSNLSQLKIPRRITRDDAVTYQIHGFCDASESGYAAVVYLRSTDDQGNHYVTLICAKSRVSPIKRMTLPRLELCAASLLAELMHYIVNIYSPIINIDNIFAWSDSMIVLSWIKSHSSNFKVFVGNRIANIQKHIPNATWQHVSGKQNPADCASRGLTPTELLNHDLWWTGPEWLVRDSVHWPSELSATQPQYIQLPECESRKLVLTNIIDIDTIDSLINKYSSLRKIQRIIAYSLRFVKALQKTHTTDHFSEHELHNALMLLVRHVQQSAFSDEIQNLKSGKSLSKSFRKLNPFLDQAGVLRVGGRLARSNLDYEAKHPALLPRKHRLTELIIQCVHNENLHPGQQTLQFLLLQNFWILSPRRAIHHVISNCYKCFRVKPKIIQPEMADLPRSRITQIKAFQSVGCDYAGPFNITFHRYRGSRTIKAYLCLFVCFATKAVHLELASDLSSEAFLAALRRFIARRGRCNTIHSDCGTNFKGAQSQLVDLMRQACVEERIVFKFNPPGAPHFGGLWEAGVKSVKTHLYRVVGTQILTYEELNTLLIQVEAVLNSRPLCPLSSDPNDLSVLTPGHFLTLAPLTTLPTPDYTNTNINRLTRWQLLQRMHQDFWSRWHKEYLCTLTQRLKWNRSTDSINVGQTVIIKDELTHPLRWRFGKIMKLFPGRDGVSRSATIKTAEGYLDRPLVKLCPIPNGGD